MNPVPKKDLSMNMATNIYMNATTKYVPLNAALKTTPQKNKQEPFIYRPPASKNNNVPQNNISSEIKPSTNPNPRSSGIQASKLSDLGSSSFFKGLDAPYVKSAQYSDRSKSGKPEQKPIQGNSAIKNEVVPGNNHFERNKKNKNAEDSVSSTQYKATYPKNQLNSPRTKEQVQQTSSNQILVRKPLGRGLQQEEKAKQAEKSPLITRKNKVQTKTSSAQQESFTTQTSSFVYQPTVRRPSVANEKSPISGIQKDVNLIGTQKKEEVKKPETKVGSGSQNIYAKNRSRESKEVELNLEINTEISYFKIESKGNISRRSSKERPNNGRQSVEVKQSIQNQVEKNEKAPIYQRPKVNTGQKTDTLVKVESPKNSDTATTKEVPYYLRPKPKVQAPETQQSQVKQPLENIKSPVKATNVQKIEEPSEPKGYVYKPKTYQNPTGKIVQDQSDSIKPKNVSESKSLADQNQPKYVPYFGRKQKQETPNQTPKTISQINPSTVNSNIATESNSITQNSQINQTKSTNIASKPYYLRQNQQQTPNKVQEKSQNAQEAPRPSLKYNSRQQPNSTMSPATPISTNVETKNPIEKAKSPEPQPEAPRYSYGRKPVLAQQQQVQVPVQQTTPKISSPKNIKIVKQVEKPQETKPIVSTQNAKINSSGYVYQPPNRKNANPSVDQKPISEVNHANSVSTAPITSSVVKPINNRYNELSNQKQQQQVEWPKNAKIQTLNDVSKVEESVSQPIKQQIRPSPISKKQQATQSKKSETSYPYKRIIQQPLQSKKQPQKTLSDPPAQTKTTVYRPAYLQNKKQPQITAKVNSDNAITDSQKQKTSKKTIPNSSFIILNILIRKKVKSNSKYAFSQIYQSFKSSINKDKLLNSLVQKSFALSTNYEAFLKAETFFLFKKIFVSSLISSTLNLPIGQGSRIIATKTVPKAKQSKEDASLTNLKQNSKKIICLKLQSIFNTKIRQAFNSKLMKPYDKVNYSAKKEPIFQALIKIFAIKTSSHLSNAFSKFKFTFSYVSKLNDQDILPLFQTKNKRFSKQQISKYLQNIYQPASLSNTASRSSLLEKTPQKPFMQKSQMGKSPSVKSFELPTQKAESQKLITLRTRIENIEKEKNQQQKIVRDRESEIVSKKLELKRQMNSLKKETQQNKKQNEDMKQKLKKYEVFNNFGDSKQDEILGSQIQMSERQGRQNFTNQQQIATSESNEFLNILCNFYVENVLKSNPSNTNPLNLEEFLGMFTNFNNFVGESLNYLLNPEDSSGFATLQSDQLMKSKLDRTKELISERILVEQNLLLKAQISSIQSQFTEENPSTLTQDSPKIQEQVGTMKNLVKNYIKERYLWEWIRNSISKI